jgi:hypothetical protein
MSLFSGKAAVYVKETIIELNAVGMVGIWCQDEARIRQE